MALKEGQEVRVSGVLTDRFFYGYVLEDCVVSTVPERESRLHRTQRNEHFSADSGLPATQQTDSKPAPDSEASHANPELGEILRSGDPYPIGLNQIRVGTHVSVLKQIYPDAEFSPAWDTWSVVLAAGVFDWARYSHFGSGDSDPQIAGVEFFFRGDTEYTHVKESRPSEFSGRRTLTPRRWERFSSGST